ncbi:hypothetical protein JCM10213_006749 [Rhodosporidiobolus nylandii]
MAAVNRPLDAGPGATSTVKWEGLGVAGIRMPPELGGSLVPPESPSTSRYKALRPRHSPSHSSPPSLAPYANSVKPPSFDAAPTPTTARKHSLQNLSGDIISYPMVSRIDIAPTYTPPSTKPPPAPLLTVATPTAKDEAPAEGSEVQKPSKHRPPPITVGTSSRSSFLSPLKGKFGHKDEKEMSQDQDRAAEGADRGKLKQKKGSAAALVEKQKADLARPSETAVNQAAPPFDDEVTLDIRLPVKAGATPRVPRLPPAHRPKHVPDPAFDALLEISSRPSGPSRHGHRRATSEDSPTIVQHAFARVAEVAERARPVTVLTASLPSSSNDRRPSMAAQHVSAARKASTVPAASNAARRPSAPRSISSTAGLPRPADAFFPPSVGASSSATPVPPPVRRPSAVPTSEGVAAVGISVREGASVAREVGRAAFSEEGLSVSLRSYHRPDELEVGWVCIPGVDDSGRPYTTWEIRLRPRGGAPSQSPPPLKSTLSQTDARARTPSTSGSFLNYRMGAPSFPSVASSVPQDSSGMFPPTSPRSEARRGAGIPLREVPPPASRKYSSRSEGSSFSSESSSGPPTPRRSGKVANASIMSMDNLPPFDLDAVLAFKPSSLPAPPHSATASTFPLADELGLTSPRRRAGRAASYANVAEHRARQFSIDEDGIMSRAASFSVGPGVVAAPPKSPKHHRFGCYIPPVSPAGADIAALATEAKRRRVASQASAGGADDQDMGKVPPLPKPPTPSVDSVLQPLSPPLNATAAAAAAASLPSPETPSRSFLASRGRKQSIAPPSALVLPPNTLVSGDRILPASTGPFTPSPLGKTTVNRLSVDGAGLETPTEARFAITQPAFISLPLPSRAAVAKTSITPTALPSPPPSGSALLFPSDASPVPSSSSFGNDAYGSELSLSLSDLGVDADADDDDDEDVFEARLVRARQTRRLKSRWSDTEGEDEDGDGPGQTSWSNVPDADED